MATTLPSYTSTIDDAFTETFFEIKTQAEDNIQTSNVISALMKDRGIFTPQTGGTNIEETIKYGKAQVPNAVGPGDILPLGIPALETAAYWQFRRYFAAVIQRNELDDSTNAGPLKIKDYVTKRLNAAMDSMKDIYEASWLRTHVTDESGRYPQGLCDMVPPPATRATGTYGNIARCSSFSGTLDPNGMLTTSGDAPAAGNTWWTPKYQLMTANPEINLLTDMRTMFDYVGQQQEDPDLILTSRRLKDMFEDYGLEAIQIFANEKMLDLGYDVLKWKGVDLTWAPGMSSGATLKDGTSAGYSGLTDAMLFLNTKRMKMTYNPLEYFRMTDWQVIPRQLDRLAYILCQQTLETPQPRRHGLLYAT